MRDRIISTLLASALVTVSIPGVVAAPVAQAYDAPASIVLVKETKRGFMARLPVAVASSAPVKVVGNGGRESIGVKTTATKVYVTDELSGEPLYALAADVPAPLASLTKLMSARVLRGHGLEWDKQVTIGALADGGGVAYFAPGDVVTVRELWRAMLIGSSNTATLTLVAASGLTLEQFVNEMNANAAGLGMANAHFVDPTGLEAGNIATARELAALAKAAFNDPEIKAAVTTPSFTLTKVTGTARKVDSTDKLLTTFMNKKPYQVLGGKTGYIVESGYNMVLSVTRDGAAPVLVVVLGSKTNELRFQEAKSLAYWAFENFRWPKSALTRAATR